MHILSQYLVLILEVQTALVELRKNRPHLVDNEPEHAAPQEHYAGDEDRLQRSLRDEIAVANRYHRRARPVKTIHVLSVPF